MSFRSTKNGGAGRMKVLSRKRESCGEIGSRVLVSVVWRIVVCAKVVRKFV